MEKKSFFVGFVSGIVLAIILGILWSSFGSVIDKLAKLLPIQKSATRALVQEFADNLASGNQEAAYALMAPQGYQLDYPLNKSYGIPIHENRKFVAVKDHVDITFIEAGQITAAMQANGISRLEKWCGSFVTMIIEDGRLFDWYGEIWVETWNGQTFILKMINNLIPCN